MKPFKLLVSVIILAAATAVPCARATDSSASATSAEATLTEAQKAKIAALRKAERKAIQAVKADTTIQDADKLAKIKAIKKDYNAQIAAVKAGK